MAYSYQEEVSNGVRTLYPVEFDFINQDDVYVYTGEHTDYTNQVSYRWADDNTVELLNVVVEAPQDTKFHIRRVTNRTELLHKFATASIHGEAIDEANLQCLHLVQEAADGFQVLSGSNLSQADLDMLGNEITNCTQLTGLSEAVTGDAAVSLATLRKYLDNLEAGVGHSDYGTVEDGLTLKLREGTKAENAGFTGSLGEPVYLTDEECLALHDSATPGGAIQASRRYVDTAQNDIVGGAIFKGSNGDVVQNGDVVPSGTTHLRVTIDGKPSIVEMSPVSSGVATSLTEHGADVGGADVKFISAAEDKEEVLASRLGLVFNSPADQSQLLIDAINTCNQENAKLYIPKGKFIKANIATDGIPVFIVGGGEVRPFAKTSPALSLKGGFEDAFNVSSVQVVTEVVTPLHGAATLTKLLVPGHNFTVNDVVKVVSEDLIPSCLVADNTRNGEWASVYAVSGNDVYLNRVLDNTYTTSPRVARIKDITCELDIASDGEETATAARQLISVIAFKEPKGNLVMRNNGGAGCYMISNYRPVFSYSAKNLANEPPTKYGYGLDDIGNAFALFINPYGEKCRHVYTTGTGGESQDIEDYGESYKSTIKFGVAVNCTSTAWDTHSQGDGVDFVGCTSDGNRASYVSRCKGVTWTACDYGDCHIGYRVLTVTDEDYASGEAIDCSGSGEADIPFSVTSQGTGRGKLTVDGGSFNFRLVTSPLQFNKAEVEFKNRPEIKTKGTSTSFSIAQIIDSNVYMDGGRLDLSTVAMGLSGVFQLNGNSSFKSSETVEVPVLGSGGGLFMTTDASNTASINAKVKTNAFNKSRQVDGINGDVELLVYDDSNEQNSTGYQSISLGATDPISYVKPLDQNVYLRVITDALGSQPSAIVDGAYPGQQCCFHCLSGGQLTISDTLSNVLVGAVIQVGEAKIATWQPAGWVFS